MVRNEQTVRSYVFTPSSVAERTIWTLDTNCTLVSQHFLKRMVTRITSSYPDWSVIWSQRFDKFARRFSPSATVHKVAKRMASGKSGVTMANPKRRRHFSCPWKNKPRSVRATANYSDGGVSPSQCNTQHVLFLAMTKSFYKAGTSFDRYINVAVLRTN